MNKKTYPIPDGCKAITMEIIDNTIVTTFEPQFKRVNPETMEVEEIKKEIPRAKNDGTYWCFGNRFGIFDSTEDGDKVDDARHYLGNYFLTKEQAQRAANKLKSALDEFWKEELK